MIDLFKIKSGLDEIDVSNRHQVKIPLHIRINHPALRFIHFFQKWIKPILAEFVATFILLFWACMLQPPVSFHTKYLQAKAQTSTRECNPKVGSEVKVRG